MYTTLMYNAFPTYKGLWKYRCGILEILHNLQHVQDGPCRVLGLQTSLCMIFAIWLFHLRVGMLVRDSEWEISWFDTGHFTHVAEITCPYGTMPLNFPFPLDWWIQI